MHYLNVAIIDDQGILWTGELPCVPQGAIFHKERKYRILGIDWHLPGFVNVYVEEV